MTQYTDLEQRGGVSLEDALAVIKNGHPPEAEGVFLLDWDDTIKPFGMMFDFTPPFEGVAKFTQDLREKGYTIGIFTSRLSPFWLNAIGHTEQQHVDFITEYSKKFGIEFDFITAEKRPSLAYIDDKAITFRGDWAEISNLFHARGWL